MRIYIWFSTITLLFFISYHTKASNTDSVLSEKKRLVEINHDNAFYYYNKEFNLTLPTADLTEQANILQNMGVVSSEIGDFKEAEVKFRQAIAVSSNDIQKAEIYFNLADCFYKQNQTDSSTYYINQSVQLAKNTKNNSLLSNINALLSEIEVKNSNYFLALGYYKRHNHYLKLMLKEKENLAILDIQKKYDFEKTQNINNRLIIKKEWIGILALFLFIVIISIISFYRHRAKRRNESMEAAELKIEQLKEMIEKAESDTQEGSGRNILIHHFNILKKAALLENYLNEEQRKGGEKVLKEFKKVLYDKENGFDWKILYQTMNELNDGKLNHVQVMYPQLDDSEFRICCLVISGFSNPEISLLLNLNLNVVQIKKSRIRKKIGVKKIENLIDLARIEGL